MDKQTSAIEGLHQGQPVLKAGEPIEQAKAAMLMVHGRGARAEDILSLAEEFNEPGFAYLAPQAADNTWYPNRFLDPVSSNEPWLSSALALLGETFNQIIGAGIPPERIILLGFSQGACLTLEFAARHARRYGGLIGLSGALIGPDESPRDYPGSFEGAPIFLGCSDVDFHVSKERVIEAAQVLKRMGGEVTVRLYPDLGHSVNQDEVETVRGIMRSLIARNYSG